MPQLKHICCYLFLQAFESYQPSHIIRFHIGTEFSSNETYNLFNEPITFLFLAGSNPPNCEEKKAVVYDIASPKCRDAFHIANITTTEETAKDVLPCCMPWVVKLQTPNTTCAGSLIGDRWVLTSARCV